MKSVSWTILAAMSAMAGCGGVPTEPVGEFGAAVGGPTLSDFGYRNMTVKGQVSIGQRKLLVVQVDDTSPPTGNLRGLPYYNSLVFGPGPVGVDVADYYFSVSRGLFTWARADPVGINLGTTPIQNGPGWYNAVLSSIVQAKPQVAYWKAFDTNNDNTITQDELGILVFKSSGSAQTSGAGSAQATVPGSIPALTLSVTITGADANEGLSTLNHELGHQLQDLKGVELYQNSSCYYNLTTMGCSVNGGDMQVWSFDPWHLLQFGWVDPASAIHSVTETATWTYPLIVGRPVILYDTATYNHFYMIERRTNTIVYDANGPGDGVLIWNVDQDPSTKLGLKTMGTRISVSDGQNEAIGIPAWDYSVWTLGPPSSVQYAGSSVWTTSATPIQLQYGTGIPYPGQLYIDAGYTLRWQHN